MNKKTKNNSFRSYTWSILVIFLISGWFYPPIGLLAIICMIAPVVVAAFSGKRKWCALFCPRGLFNDVILSKISHNVKPPVFFRSNIFKAGFLFFLIFNLISGLAKTTTLAQAGFVFVRLVSLTTGITIILGVLYHQRTWCGFCPMGFLASLTIQLKQLLNVWRPNPARKPRIVPSKPLLFTANHCPSCEEIKSLLEEKKIKFSAKNIDTNKSAREEMFTIYKSTSFPTLIMKGNIYQNPSVEDLKKILQESKTTSNSLH